MFDKCFEDKHDELSEALFHFYTHQLRHHWKDKYDGIKLYLFIQNTKYFPI